MINLDDIRPNTSFRLYYGQGHPANKLMHIRAIVDDAVIVYREWSRHKQRWIYHAETITFFEMANDMGILQKSSTG